MSADVEVETLAAPENVVVPESALVPENVVAAETVVVPENVEVGQSERARERGVRVPLQPPEQATKPTSKRRMFASKCSYRP